MYRLRLLLCCALLAEGFSAAASAQARNAGVRRLELTVDGLAREVFIAAPPSSSTAAPVVFVFHGHGGTAVNAARTFRIRQHWPEALAVYMQGLNTPGRLTDPEGKKPGWQARAGDQNDRDLKFFDAVLARLKEDYQIDENRIYSTGHSNGGAFTYLLWAERGDLFAAFAPSAAAAAESLPKLKPKPALHIAGEKDGLVRFEWQRRTIDTIRKVDGCEPAGSPWAEHCTLYPSKAGTPFIAFIHPGAHVVPSAAPELIVRFFKEHTRKQD